MDRVREILRLKAENYSQRKVSQLTGIPRSSVQNYFVKADACGITFLEAKDLSDDELRERFGKRVPGRERAEIQDPNFSLIHNERMSRKGVTLELLYNEWKEETKTVYSYNTFCRRYQEWGMLQKLVLRNEYEPGDRAFSDYSGATLSYFDNEGREQKIEIFVSTLAASNLIYAEASLNQKVLSWCNSHVRAFDYFGGSPKLLGIDNLKSGVIKSCRS